MNKLTLSLFLLLSCSFISVTGQNFPLLEPSERNFSLLKRPNDYRTGLVYSGSIGFSKYHTSLNGNLSYALSNGLEFGIGIGFHNNRLSLPINNLNDSLSINGTPVFITGRYFLANFWDDILKPYVRTRIGYSFATANSEETNGRGFIFENSLGLELRINWNEYVFIECSQYNQKALGSMVDNNRDLSVNYNLWFNDIVFRLGYTRRLFE